MFISLQCLQDGAHLDNQSLPRGLGPKRLRHHAAQSIIASHAAAELLEVSHCHALPHGTRGSFERGLSLSKDSTVLVANKLV